MSATRPDTAAPAVPTAPTTILPPPLAPTTTPALDAAAVLDAVRAAFERFTVQQTAHHYVALTVYTLYTHVAGHFDIAPRLVITSAEKRSGKTRTLELLGELVADPFHTINATPAVLFSRIAADPAHPPTVIFDEADAVFGTSAADRHEDLRALINGGFQRNKPFSRMRGGIPTDFETFAPLILAGIGDMPDTITDRSVFIRIKRRRPEQHVEPYRMRQAGAALHPLRDHLARIAETAGHEFAQYRPPTNLADRSADVWEPLYASADLAGGSWPELTREAGAYLAYDAERVALPSEGIECLRDIAAALGPRLGAGGLIETGDLLDRLAALPDTAWTDLTGRRLALILKPYGVHPTRTNAFRGYRLAAVDEAVRTWLPTSEADAEGMAP